MFECLKIKKIGQSAAKTLQYMLDTMSKVQRLSQKGVLIEILGSAK